MRRTFSTKSTAAAVLLLLSALAAAHGHDSSMDMGMTKVNATAPAHSSFIADKVWNMPSYVGLGEHTGPMWAHIILMVLAWFFALPIGTPSTCRNSSSG